MADMQNFKAGADAKSFLSGFASPFRFWTAQSSAYKSVLDPFSFFPFKMHSLQTCFFLKKCLSIKTEQVENIHTSRFDAEWHGHTVHLLSIFGVKYHIKDVLNDHVPGFTSLNIFSIFLKFWKTRARRDRCSGSYEIKSIPNTAVARVYNFEYKSHPAALLAQDWTSMAIKFM